MSKKKELFQELKLWRLTKANEEGIPAYYIFKDITLHDICDLLPTCDSELLHIRGIGEKKLQKFGRELLDIIFGHLSKFDNLVSRAEELDDGIVEIAEVLSRSVSAMKTENVCAVLESTRMALNYLLHKHCDFGDGSCEVTDKDDPRNPLSLSTQSVVSINEVEDSAEESEQKILERYRLSDWLDGQFGTISPDYARIIRKNLHLWGRVYEGFVMSEVDPQIVSILRGDDDVDIDMSDPDQKAALCLRARLECDTKGPRYTHQERRQELSDDQAWAESRRRQLRDSWDT